MHSRAVVVVALVLAFFAACSSEDATPDAPDPSPGPSLAEKHQVLAEGSGPQNDAPLLSLNPGTRRTTKDESRTCLDDTTKWGMKLRRCTSGGNVFWYSRDDFGWYLVGSSQVGAYVRPALSLPHKLRVGMQWRVWPQSSDTAYVTYTVKSAEVKPTVFGKRKVWEVEGVGTSGSPLTNFYGEGVGFLTASNVGATPVIRSGVVPLDEAASPPDPPTLKVSAMVGGAGVLPKFITQSVVVTDGLGKPGFLYRYALKLHGLAFISTNAIGSQAFGGAESAYVCAYTDGTHFTASKVHLASYTSKFECPDGRADQRFPLADGQLAQAGIVPVQTGGPSQLEFALTVPSAKVPAYSSGPMHAVVFPQEPAVDFLLADGPDAAGTLGLGVVAGERLLHLAVGKDGRFSPERMAATLPLLQWASVYTGDAADHWLVSPDGDVLHAALGPAGVQLERMGRVPVPKGEVASVAFPLGDQLVVITSDADPNYGVIEVANMDPGHAWRTPLPKGPTETPDRLQASALAVSFTPRDMDLEVCWPAGLGAPILEGWTLGGAPSKAIAVSDRCVLVLRNREVAWDLDEEGLHAAEGPVPGVGKVAIGLENALANKQASIPDPGVMVLPSGEARSANVVYGRGMVPVSTVSSVDRLAPGGTPDPYADGFWFFEGVYGAECGKLGGPCKRVSFAGKSGTWTQLLADGGVETMLVGGGILWERKPVNAFVGDLFLVTPKGDVTPFDVPFKHDTHGVNGATSDGLACGTAFLATNPQLQRGWCRLPDGTVQELTPADPKQLGKVYEPWLGAPGAFFTYHDEPVLRLTRFDTKTLAFTDVDLGALAVAPVQGLGLGIEAVRQVPGPDLWFVRRIGGKDLNVALGHYEAGKVTAVPLPGLDLLKTATTVTPGTPHVTVLDGVVALAIGDAVNQVTPVPLKAWRWPR